MFLFRSPLYLSKILFLYSEDGRHPKSRCFSVLGVLTKMSNNSSCRSLGQILLKTFITLIRPMFYKTGVSLQVIKNTVTN